MVSAAALDRNRATPAIVEGEFHFTLEDFRAIAGMIHSDAGIALTESKATLVYSRLAKRLRVLGLESIAHSSPVPMVAMSGKRCWPP